MAKSKCTEEAIKLARKAKGSGMSNRDMAAYIGIDEATLYRWLASPKSENQRAFCETIKKAESEYKAALRTRILKASEGSWQAAAWMLERQYPDEYAKRDRREKVEEDTVPTITFDFGA